MTILGRMAGIEEATLDQLIAAGQAATILGKFDLEGHGRTQAPANGREGLPLPPPF